MGAAASILAPRRLFHSHRIFTMAQYIRVKRKNQTIFLYADASEKVADLKGKLAKINEKSADELALIFNDAKLDNDKTVYLVYKQEGSDEFEEVDIQKPKPAEGSEP